MPKWCPSCRVLRNRQATAARRRASAAPKLSGRPAGHDRVRADVHLAQRVTLLRLANAGAAAELRQALAGQLSTTSLVAACAAALATLDTVPVGR